MFDAVRARTCSSVSARALLVSLGTILLAPASATAQTFELPAAFGGDFDIEGASWGPGCTDGTYAPHGCAVAASLRAMRQTWQAWVANPSESDEPWARLDALDAGLDTLVAAAADECGRPDGAMAGRIAEARAAMQVMHLLDGIGLVWLAAGEGVMMPPYDDDTQIDELTSVFGIPAYCDRQVVHADGRWGRLRITVGDREIRMIQNPLERLLMCSNFLSIVTLQVADTGPNLVLPPLQAAGLVPEPYATMSAAELEALADSEAWQAIVGSVPPERVWWEMVEHPDEQLAVWTSALGSGFIDAPAALLYGARSIGPESRDTLARALSEPMAIDAGAPLIESWLGPDAAPVALGLYRDYVPEDFVVGPGEDGLEVVMHHDAFRDAFLGVIANEGWDRNAPTRQYQNLARAAEEWGRALAFFEDTLVCAE